MMKDTKVSIIVIKQAGFSLSDHEWPPGQCPSPTGSRRIPLRDTGSVKGPLPELRPVAAEAIAGYICFGAKCDEKRYVREGRHLDNLPASPGYSQKNVVCHRG